MLLTVVLEDASGREVDSVEPPDPLPLGIVQIGLHLEFGHADTHPRETQQSLHAGLRTDPCECGSLSESAGSPPPHGLSECDEIIGCDLHERIEPAIVVSEQVVEGDDEFWERKHLRHLLYGAKRRHDRHRVVDLWSQAEKRRLIVSAPMAAHSTRSSLRHAHGNLHIDLGSLLHPDRAPEQCERRSMAETFFTPESRCVIDHPVEKRIPC